MKRAFTPLVLAGAVLAFGACSQLVDTAVNRAGTTAGTAIGDAAGRSVGSRAAASTESRMNRAFTPQLTTLYASYMFTYAFTPGGYLVEPAEYVPGQWTKWAFVENGKATGAWLEKAYLRRTDDGKEWWRVAWHDGENDDTIILEALFDADKTTVLRLRSKFPDQEVSEMPVEQGTSIYRGNAIRVTDESLEGATVNESERVTVPAGAYTARHVRYGNAMGGGSIEWWLADSVPGGIVKYQNVGQSGDTGGDGPSEYYTLELSESGASATTQLGSFR